MKKISFVASGDSILTMKHSVHSEPQFLEMVKRIGTFRSKTRHKFKKPHRAKGKLSLTKYFQTFKEGDRVGLHIEPAVQGGVYFPRFLGKNGVIIGKQGDCYQVQIKDKNKEKTLIVHPVHLKRL